MTRTNDVSILYVEDDAAIRENLLVFLKRRFGKVWQAENGLDGLSLYLERLPDIVMTDIRMPIMDGLAMTRGILKQNSKAPIIITSAHNETDDLLEAIELGISHYLLKPLDTVKMEASLQHCVELVRKARALGERESTFVEAYQTINSLIDYGEQCIDCIISPCNEVEYQLDQVIEKIVRGSDGRGTHSPASLVVTLTHGLAGQPSWFWYDLGTDGPCLGVSYLEHPALDLTSSDGCHALYYLNEDDPLPDDPLLISFIEHLDRCQEHPRNLVWYRNGARVVCGLNYPARVTACDAAVIKSLAVQARYLDNLSTQCHQTEEAFQYTITSLARAAEANDEDTGNHIIRVGEYCAAICRRIGYSDELANTIARQSQLHDVGKIHVLPEILRKPGKLTETEMTLVKEHTLFGAQIIGNHPRLEIARTIALHHHERWDGSGYPYGLRETGIPLEARILTIADTYDALRTNRCYKPAFDHDTACRIILEGDGRTEPVHFDPDLLNTFKEINRGFDEIYERFATVASDE